MATRLLAAVVGLAVATISVGMAPGVGAAPPAAPETQARADALAYLGAQLGDRALAADIGPALFDASFVWPAPAPSDRVALLKAALDRVSALPLDSSQADAAPTAATTTTSPSSSPPRSPSARRARGEAIALLARALGDAALAHDAGQMLFDASFTWQPPTVPVGQVDTIVAYSFGNRVAADGRVTPGPMNEQLAATVHRLARRRPHAPVYAQWEIAHVLRDRYGMHDVISIEPETAADGSAVYLSTQGVAEKIASLAGGGAKLGRVAVVAWRDHVRRTVATSAAAGMRAAAPAGVTMPDRYDPESGQPWTRARRAYLVHDVQARLLAASTEARSG